MPRADSDTPRKMLPPPTTTATSTPRRAVSAISPATWVRTSGLMPYPWLPISASPEILRRMRLYAGLTIAPATLAPRGAVGNRRAEDPRAAARSRRRDDEHPGDMRAGARGDQRDLRHGGDRARRAVRRLHDAIRVGHRAWVVAAVPDHREPVRRHGLPYELVVGRLHGRLRVEQR